MKSIVHRAGRALLPLLFVMPHPSRLEAQAPGEPGSSYHVARRITVGGEGGWDYLTYDPVRHHLFLSHATQVEVLDPDRGEVVGRIPDTPGVHGIALAQDLGRGFVSNGRDSSVTVFDLATLAVVGRVKVTGANPDAILYDSVSRRVFTFNGRSDNATAIDARADTVIGTLDLGGKPEFAVSDNRGGAFVNLEDKSELAAFDPKALAVRSVWPLPDCEEPSALALDREHERLFSGCGNRRMVVLDARSGRVVAWAPIGDGVDAAAYDPATRLAFASTGDGTLTVIHEDSPDSVHVAATVPTQRGARTMALDPATHRVFVVTASFGPAPAPTPERPRPRPSIVPGTFTVLVVEP
jgi:DNA-binding beta-propeller fold protein YncE